MGPTVSDLFDFVVICQRVQQQLWGPCDCWWGGKKSEKSVWVLLPCLALPHKDHGKHSELGRGMLHLTQTCSQGKAVWHREIWHTKEWSGRLTINRSCKKCIRDFTKSICPEVAFQKLLARGFCLQAICACVLEPDMWNHIPVCSLLN